VPWRLLSAPIGISISLPLKREQTAIRLRNAAIFHIRCTFLKAALLLAAALSTAYELQESPSTDSTPGGNNCTTADSFLVLRSRNETQGNEMDTMAANVLADGTRNNSNVSYPRTLTLPEDWDDKPRLKFPKFATEERYRMASLHLDKGCFAFDFLRRFLSFVQPYDVSTGKT